MAWLELRTEVKPDIAEDFSSLLTELGALAVSIQDAGDQPIYEPAPDSTPLWDQLIMTGLFDEACNIQQILDTITLRYPHLMPEINHLEDQDWERAWMADFKPMKFGERLWIVPKHHAQDLLPHQVVLDPGLAFGTGKHPTTALCLEWLDQHIIGNEVVIDYGCGSGILAIAAIKLGAKKVFAIDYDPQAILATQENMAENQISADQIIVFHSHEAIKEKADILVANILANPLIDLVDQFTSLLRSNGKIVLSGILDFQIDSILDVYKKYFEINEVVCVKEWVRIVATKI